MIEKTEALVLRVSPFSRTSHVVTWITPEHGRLATVVKGAMRPKSAFLGQYDLFYTCELLYYIKERNGTHIAKECAPIKTRGQLRSDWRSAACASYISDLVARLSVRGGHQHDIYELADEALDSICTTSATPQFIFWFELRMLELLGLSPRLSGCSVCSASLIRGQRIGFSARHGGVVCGKCRNTPGAGIQHISPDILAILRTWQNAESCKIVQNTRCRTNQLLDLQRILDTFLSFHLDTQALSRKIAVEMTSPQRIPSR